MDSESALAMAQVLDQAMMETSAVDLATLVAAAQAAPKVPVDQFRHLRLSKERVCYSNRNRSTPKKRG